MSDVSRGPGWWRASDGKWYPPETHPDPAQRAPAPIPPMAPPEPGEHGDPLPPNPTLVRPSPQTSVPPLVPPLPGFTPLADIPLPSNTPATPAPGGAWDRSAAAAPPPSPARPPPTVPAYTASAGPPPPPPPPTVPPAFAGWAGLPSPPPVPPAPTEWAGASEWGAGSTWPAPAGRLDLHVAEPARQARWKTFLRFLLAWPNALVVGVVGIPLIVVVPVMWLCALITGRVPAGLWRYSRSILQWQTRLNGYTYLLTARYPPFSLHDEPYPVAFTLEGPPEHLNRVAVFFRLFLVVPAEVMSIVYQVGVAVVLAVAWLVALVTGRVPRPLHQVIATGLRYSVRYSAYASLLTSEYPWGLLGDAAYRSGRPSGDVLTLEGGTKVFAVLALVFGILVGTLCVVLIPVFLSVTGNRAVAILAWDSMQARAESDVADYHAQLETCRTELPCVEQAASILSNALRTQIRTIGSIKFPTTASAQAAGEIVPLLRREVGLMVEAQHASSPPAYLADVQPLAPLTAQITPLAARLTSALKRF